MRILLGKMNGANVIGVWSMHLGTRGLDSGWGHDSLSLERHHPSGFFSTDSSMCKQHVGMP